MDQIEGRERQSTMAVKNDGQIGYEHQQVSESLRPTISGNEVMQSFTQPRESMYEKAPGEDINNETFRVLNESVD
jgi:hypothetical protein